MPIITEMELHNVGLAVDTASDTLVSLTELNPANMTAVALAAFVLHCHERGTQAVLTSAEWFWRAGNALEHAKESKIYGDHGDWEQWVRDKCKISTSQARKYRLWARQVEESQVKAFASERFDLEAALGFRSNEEVAEEAQPNKGTSRSAGKPATVPKNEAFQPIKVASTSMGEPATVPEKEDSQSIKCASTSMGEPTTVPEKEDSQSIKGASTSVGEPTTVPEKEDSQSIKGSSTSVGEPATSSDKEEDGEEDRRYSLTVIIRLSPEIDVNDLEDLLTTDQVHWVLKNGNGKTLGTITVESVEDLQRA